MATAIRLTGIRKKDEDGALVQQWPELLGGAITALDLNRARGATVSNNTTAICLTRLRLPLRHLTDLLRRLVS